MGAGTLMIDDSVEYWLDGQDRIVKVNDGWHNFYQENTAGGSSDIFVGRPLFDWIVGLEVQEIIRYLLTKVRQSREMSMVPFRCDSPDKVRQLVMCIDSPDGATVHFQTWVLRTTVIDLPPNWASKDPITVCSWCKRVQSLHSVLGMRWINLEDAVREMGLLERKEIPKLTHGICADCKKLIKHGMGSVPSHLAF
jgi:hypothetical protein